VPSASRAVPADRPNVVSVAPVYTCCNQTSIALHCTTLPCALLLHCAVRWSAVQACGACVPHYQPPR
jgi:hypothetical protein